MNLYISINPSVCHGQASFTGTRIPIHQVLKMMANGDTIPSLIEYYPSLTEEAIRAAMNCSDITA